MWLSSRAHSSRGRSELRLPLPLLSKRSYAEVFPRQSGRPYKVWPECSNNSRIADSTTGTGRANCHRSGAGCNRVCDVERLECNCEGGKVAKGADAAIASRPPQAQRDTASSKRVLGASQAWVRAERLGGVAAQAAC